MYFHEDGGGYSAEKESSEGVRAHTSETLSQKHIHAYARAEWSDGCTKMIVDRVVRHIGNVLRDS